MRTKRTNRRRLRRLIAPTAGLYRYVAMAVAGVVLFLFGAVIIFRVLLEPFSDEVSARWEEFVIGLGYSEEVDTATHVLGLLLVVLGLYFVYLGVKRFDRRVA